MKLESIIMELMKVFDDYGDVTIVLRDADGCEIDDFFICADSEEQKCVLEYK